MANNTLKYKRVDAALREKKQKEWNQPVILPLILLFLFVIFVGFLLIRIYKNRQKAVISKEENQ